NPAAKEGLQACLEALVERDLSVRNPGGAHTILDEMPDPRPDLRERPRGQKREIEDERAEIEQAKREAREMDRSISAWMRAGMTGIAAVFVVLSTFVWKWYERETGFVGAMPE